MNVIFRQLFHWNKENVLLFTTFTNQMLHKAKKTPDSSIIMNSYFAVNLKSEQIVHINLSVNGRLSLFKKSSQLLLYLSRSYKHGKFRHIVWSLKDSQRRLLIITN